MTPFSTDSELRASSINHHKPPFNSKRDDLRYENVSSEREGVSLSESHENTPLRCEPGCVIINPCKVAVGRSLSKNAKVIQSVRGPNKILEMETPKVTRRVSCDLKGMYEVPRPGSFTSSTGHWVVFSSSVGVPHFEP